jgi:hypothetical protein
MKRVFQLMLVLVALAVAHVPAASATLLFENYAPAAIGWEGGAGKTLGAQFTVGPQSLSVTKLGIFGTPVAAFPIFMSVGIWDVDDPTTPVGFAQVPSTGAIPIQGWNFTAVTPFTLLAGEVYRIGAVTQTGTIAFGGTYDMGSGIASVSSGHVRSGPSGFAYPDGSFPTDRFFAANAEIAPIPEPASVVLLLLGLAGIWFVRRRA